MSDFHFRDEMQERKEDDEKHGNKMRRVENLDMYYTELWNKVNHAHSITTDKKTKKLLSEAIDILYKLR